jgi:very-short-patch-repair endonuclease
MVGGEDLDLKSYPLIRGKSLRNSSRLVWALARRQHGVITRAQLLEIGLSPRAIQGRIDRGRLHPIFRGVYGVGRPELTQRGRWMAAVLSCGPGAVLSHASAAALWTITAQRPAPSAAIDVSVPPDVHRRRSGIHLHRRVFRAGHKTRRDGIPVTSPARTLLDLAGFLPEDELEAAVNQADKLWLIDPERLRTQVETSAGLAGVAALRQVLDRRTFRLTDSELERRFLRLVRRAGLPLPRTRQRVNGYRVDFYWPEFALVVETDGLRYHRTAAQQARDRERDQAHLAAGLTPLRFTHAQIAFEPARVTQLLCTVAERQRLAMLGAKRF